jgi:hypothetical protein
VREKLTPSKQTSQYVDKERFNVKKVMKEMLKYSIRLQMKMLYLWKI